MTLKEFIDLCVANHLPADVEEDEGDKFDKFRFIIGVDRLEDLRNLNVASREIDAFTIGHKANGALRWIILVKKR